MVVDREREPEAGSEQPLHDSSVPESEHAAAPGEDGPDAGTGADSPVAPAHRGRRIYPL